MLCVLKYALFKRKLHKQLRRKWIQLLMKYSKDVCSVLLINGFKKILVLKLFLIVLENLRFSLNDLSNSERGVLKLSSIIVLRPIWVFTFCRICFMAEVHQCLGHEHSLSLLLVRWLLQPLWVDLLDVFWIILAWLLLCLTWESTYSCSLLASICL